MKLLKHVLIEGEIRCLTGLRIGGSSDYVDIGGIGNNIIRHPLTGYPYIPGSSLKGKMRSLLEYRYSNVSDMPCRCGYCKVCEYFGSFGRTKAPTRILVRDANMTVASLQTLQKAQIDQGIYFAEVKTENVIKRNTGEAHHPRSQERVPSGTEFSFEISVRIFDRDDEKDLIDFLCEGMQLLEKDYLGSSGGRGYGQIRFLNVTADGERLSHFDR